MKNKIFKCRSLYFKILLQLFLLVPAAVIARHNRSQHEKIIFEFDTQSGKHVSICSDTLTEYLVYRIQKGNKTELEFPAKTKSSWSRFNYSSYLRGGGVQNEGMELNYLFFTNGNYKYVLSDTYFSVTKSHQVGIRIINLKTKAETYIKGKADTRKGSLIYFRGNDLVTQTDELFD